MFSASKTAGPSGYAIQRSVRFRSSASAYFNRTLASSGTTATFSAWVKRGALGSASTIFGTTDGSTYDFQLTFTASNTLEFYSFRASAVQLDLITTQVFRDPSAWYHIVLVLNTTNATAANRVQIFVNGVQVTAFSTATYPAQNAVTPLADSRTFGIGDRGNANNNFFDGYLTEINFIDGQALTPTSFGAYNSTTGVWQPIKYTGTYGTNGFYLNFQDNSAATAAAIGKDSSGNGNNWTPNNISVTAGATYDSMLDVPTLTSATNANFPTLNPLFGSSITLGNTNLSITSSVAGNAQRLATMAVSSGKWYYEVTLTSLPAGSDPMAGFTEINNTSAVSQYPGQASNSYSIYNYTANSFLQKVNNSVFTNTNTSPAAQGNIISVALDLDNNKIWFAKNGTWVDSGDPAAGTNSQFTVTAGTYAPAFRGSGGGVSCTIDANFGQRPFTYTPPSGFKSLNTYNLATPTIPNGAAQFAATLYTGNHSTNAITNTVNGKSFQPDFIWIKDRSAVTAHALFDSVRGVGGYLSSNNTTAEDTTQNYAKLNSFNSNGFTLGASTLANDITNYSGDSFVGWQWKASNTTAVTNTSGSITSQVSANPTAGFSIVTYTATAATGTIGHGLGVTPSMIITARRSTSGAYWGVYHKSLGASQILYMQTTGAATADSTTWNATSPTSSVFSVGNSAQSNNPSSATYVAYCFAEIAGFSKFGSYTGNGAADGPFVYTGFRPRYVCVKRSDGVGGWTILDSSRDTYNVAGQYLFAETSAAEGSTPLEDFLSNGFKLRATSSSVNSAGTYIYFAFAENPFNYSLAR